MLTRYASAVTSGTMMTFALLYVMQILISLQPAAEVPTKEPLYVDWVRLIKDTPVARDKPEVIKEKLTQTNYPPERIPQSGDAETITVPGEKPHLPPRDTGIHFDAPVDGALVNMFRVSPTYPVRAQAMGLEGHVIVQFDVDANGQVINPVILESSHRMFEKSAIQAALAFRYKPRVVDGVALPTRGIRNLFTFNMDE